MSQKARTVSLFSRTDSNRLIFRREAALQVKLYRCVSGSRPELEGPTVECVFIILLQNIDEHFERLRTLSKLDYCFQICLVKEIKLPLETVPSVIVYVISVVYW